MARVKVKSIDEILRERDQMLSSQGHLTKKDLGTVYGIGSLETVRKYLKAAGLDTNTQSYQEDQLREFHHVYEQVALRGRRLVDVEAEYRETAPQGRQTTARQEYGNVSGFAGEAAAEPQRVIQTVVLGNLTETIRQTTRQFLQPDVLNKVTTIVMAQEFGANPDLAEQTTDFFSQSLQSQTDMEELLTAELQTLGLLPEIPNNMLLPASSTTDSGSANLLSGTSQDSYLDVSAQVIDIYQGE
jgi:hypothetical protein